VIDTSVLAKSNMGRREYKFFLDIIIWDFDNIEALEAIHHYKLEDADNKNNIEMWKDEQQ
jgi:hypothetical protein